MDMIANISGFDWLLAVMVGGCIGSFVSLASYRLPRQQDIMWVRSRCISCDNNLQIIDLIPVISWIIAGGNCRYCQHNIGIRYLLIEIITIVITVLLYYRYGISMQMLFMLLLATALLVMSISDLETGLIPDSIHIFLLPLALIYHWFMASDMAAVVISGLVGAVIGAMLHYGYLLVRGYHGLGFGDVKFLAVAGLWLGTIEGFVAFIFYSGVLGVIMGVAWRMLNSGKYFPFAPALAVGLFSLISYPALYEYFWQMIRLLISF